MDDLVSRQKVLRCIKESRENIDWGQSEDGDAFLHYSAALYRTIASIDCLPSAQKWIPCSERLPEKYGEYFVTWTCDNCQRPLIEIIECEETSKFDYELCGFKMEWIFSDIMEKYKNPKVIAWMELPEPWKGSED